MIKWAADNWRFGATAAVASLLPLVCNEGEMVLRL